MLDRYTLTIDRYTSPGFLPFLTDVTDVTVVTVLRETNLEPLVGIAAKPPKSPLWCTL